MRGIPADGVTENERLRSFAGRGRLSPTKTSTVRSQPRASAHPIFPFPRRHPSQPSNGLLAPLPARWPQVLKHSSSDVSVEIDAAHSQRHKPSVRRPRWARLEAEGGKNENADHHLGTALLEQGHGTPVRQTHHLAIQSPSNPLYPPDGAEAANHPALDARHQSGTTWLIRLRRAYRRVRADGAVSKLGALGGIPAEGVTENGNAGRRQGKAFPPSVNVGKAAYQNAIYSEKY